MKEESAGAGRARYARFAVRYGLPGLGLSAAMLLGGPPLLRRLAESEGFMPHGHCYLWQPGLVRLHLGSDLLIGVSYVAISVMLAVLVRKARRDIPFGWAFLAFGVFIVACGGTHFMEMWTLYHPHYWASGFVKLVTAVASVGTALLLPGLIPKAVALGEAARLARTRQQELERAHQELEAFSYSVAHDLRSPLRRMSMNAELALRALADAGGPAQPELARIKDAAASMGALIEALLQLGRVSRGEVARARFDLTAAANETLAQLRASEPGRAVEAKVAAGLTAVGDPALLGALLQNLLGNSWKFTAQRAPATIEVGSLERDEGTVYFVRDNGLGFEETSPGEVFEPFKRLHGLEIAGSGVGLAIVKRIVERHGGRIWAESEPGKGAAFYFTLA